MVFEAVDEDYIEYPKKCVKCGNDELLVEGRMTYCMNKNIVDGVVEDEDTHEENAHFMIERIVCEECGYEFDLEKLKEVR